MARFSKLIAAGLGVVGAGAGLLYSSSSTERKSLLAAQKFEEPVLYSKKPWQGFPSVIQESPSVNKWDYNWDRREPYHMVEPSKGGEDDVRFKRDLEDRKPKATRHLLLIRHGQYNLNGPTDKERTLTEKGIEQAILTGKRLAVLNLPYQQMVRSTMTRAQQTGEYILTNMKTGSMAIKNDNMLEEGAPCPPEPSSFTYKPMSYEYYQDGSRIEAAFRNYVYRADYRQKEDSYDIIVCHGNVIRYFVCRALQLPPEAWLRMQVNHASITWLCIRPSGVVSLKSLGDCGHLPPDLLT